MRKFDLLVTDPRSAETVFLRVARRETLALRTQPTRCARSSAENCVPAETLLTEAKLLCITDGRWFGRAMDAQSASSLREDKDRAERVDASVARLGRLQDTLLPGLLA